MRGVPLDADGYFFEPLWTTSIRAAPQPGILDWYTVLIGLLALATLMLHGANFISVKTEGDLNARARGIARMAGRRRRAGACRHAVTFSAAPGHARPLR